MVAVVRPHRHLLLRMVERMQLPPPLKMVLASVNPIIHKIKDNQVDQQANPRNIRDSGKQTI